MTNTQNDSSRLKRSGQIGQPDGIFFWAIVLGAALTAVGVIALALLDMGLTEGRLLLCSGLGILFGAFGSKATVKYKGITVTGVAATAIILLYIVVELTSTEITYGHIEGDVRNTSVEIITDDSLFRAYRTDERRYEFVVMGEKLETAFFSVWVTIPPDEENGEGEHEIQFERIEKGFIEKFLGTGKRFEWRFDRDPLTLTEVGEDHPFATIEPMRTNANSPLTRHADSTELWPLIARARAASAARGLEEIFPDLRSNIASVRLKARRELAHIGVDAVAPMMLEMRQYETSYRVRLGVLVALTQMLRDDKKRAPKVSSELTDNDLQLIVNAVVDRDHTIRVNAAGFLFALGDKRILEQALHVAKSTENEEGSYLAVFVIKGIFEMLDAEAQRKATVDLRVLRSDDFPKTRELIGSFVSLPPDTDVDWNFRIVKAREALAIMSEIGWRDVRVAVIGTGYTTHPVFGPWDNDNNEIVLAENGVNYVERGGLPLDPLDYHGFPGHWTRTTSVLSGNLPGTFVGVAPGVPTVPYRVTNTVILNKLSRRKNIASAIRHAIDKASSQVIAIPSGVAILSLIGGRPMGNAIDYAYDNGIIVIAPAGQIIDRAAFPARFARTIGVGGSTERGQIWFRYSDSSLIDVWAPAEKIRRADATLGSDGKNFKPHFGTGNGTSYAAMHVAAAAAMWLAHRKDGIEELYRNNPWQVVEAFRTLLADTSNPLRGVDSSDISGGVLDIAALLESSLPDPESLKKTETLAASERF